MTKELVEDIMDLEANLETELAKAAVQKDALIKKARQKAMLLIQEAEHSMTSERESLIRAHDKTLHQQKQQLVDAARVDAQALARSVQGRIEPAAMRVLQEFTEGIIQ